MADNRVWQTKALGYIGVWGNFYYRSYTECLHTEVTLNVNCSYNRKTGKLSYCLGRKCETRSDPLKGNQSQARIKLIGLKGREAGREKRNKNLANRSRVLAVGTYRWRNVTVTLSNRLWQEPDIYLRKKSCRMQLSAEPGWHSFADAIFWKKLNRRLYPFSIWEICCSYCSYSIRCIRVDTELSQYHGAVPARTSPAGARCPVTGGVCPGAPSNRRRVWSRAGWQRAPPARPPCAALPPGGTGRDGTGPCSPRRRRLLASPSRSPASTGNRPRAAQQGPSHSPPRHRRRRRFPRGQPQGRAASPRPLGARSASAGPPGPGPGAAGAARGGAQGPPSAARPGPAGGVM